MPACVHILKLTSVVDMIERLPELNFCSLSLSLSLSLFLSAIVEVPEGRRCHVFISHSTSDRFWAEKTVLEPLSKTWKVRASFQSMPDSSRYDNARIMDDMRCSCVVIIGLSPAYEQSGRFVILPLRFLYKFYKVGGKGRILRCLAMIR